MNDMPMYRDETASVYAAAAPDGGPAVMIVGAEAVAASRFDPWAAALLSVSRLPGVATVFQAAREPDGRPMLVVDAAGVTLAERLVGQGPLPVAEVHTTGLALASALAQVHATGLWHGAVCPSTVVYADGVRLAGFDACAPGLAKPAAPSWFAAPEGVPGPAGDVYGLALTLYVALGGRPARQIGELNDVPPPLTAALRAGMSPDPVQRPTAQQLYQALTVIGATENTLPAVPVEAALVGSPVRPVNQAVISINLAVAGAAVTGLAATAGIVAGQGAAGALSALGTGAGAGAKAAVSKGFIGGLSALKIGAFAAGAAVVAAGVVVGVNVLDDEPAGPGPLVTAIQQFDFKNTTFVDAALGQSAQLVDGQGEPYDSEDDSAGYRLADDPIVYADADGDNDLDAMVVLAKDGGNNLYRWPYVWLWEDGKAVQLPFPLADAGRCGNDFEPPTVKDGHFAITRKIAVAVPDCAGPQFQEDKVEIAVEDGYPVSVSPHGAAASCVPAEYEAVMEVVNYQPLVAPDEKAPAVDAAEKFTKLEVVYTTWDETDPVLWLRVRMTRTDGSVSCGWVPNNGLDD